MKFRTESGPVVPESCCRSREDDPVRRACQGKQPRREDTYYEVCLFFPSLTCFQTLFYLKVILITCLHPKQYAGLLRADERICQEPRPLSRRNGYWSFLYDYFWHGSLLRSLYDDQVKVYIRKQEEPNDSYKST